MRKLLTEHAATVVLCILVAVSGCLGPAGATGTAKGSEAEDAGRDSHTSDADTTPANFSWNESGREPIVRIDWYGIPSFESGPSCVFGGFPIFPRVDGHVLNETARLEVAVEMPVGSIYTGLHIGYAIDSNHAPYSDGASQTITWGPAMYASGGRYDIPVRENQFEDSTSTERWDFYYTIHPSDPGDCQAGAGLSQFNVRIEAVRRA